MSDPWYTLSVILESDVQRYAAEVLKDRKLAFRIATALGPEAVKRFPTTWKQRRLKVGDVLLQKVYLVKPEHDSIDQTQYPFNNIPWDFHVCWYYVKDVGKTGKNITLQELLAEEYVNEHNPAILYTRPVVAAPAEFKRGAGGVWKTKRWSRSVTVRHLDKQELDYPVFLDTRPYKDKPYVRHTFETVDWVEGGGFIQVPVVHTSTTKLSAVPTIRWLQG